MQAEGIRAGDRGLHGSWEALEDAVVGPDGQSVTVKVRTPDGRVNPAHYVVGEQVPLSFGVGPQFPPGTPEYAEYSTKLHAELEKFVQQEPPYDAPIQGYPGAARAAGFGR